MDMTLESCRTFVQALASDTPTPGGGGAAALVGAIGTALGNMVAALTVGKKKYADVEAELIALQSTCNALQKALLDQVEADHVNFLPLSRAYRIPKDDPDRERIMEEATVTACLAPMRIMELCCQALDALAVFAEKGNRLVISDAACGAVCLRGALQAAGLNVFTNTSSMKNRETAQSLNARCQGMLDTYLPLADRIFNTIQSGYLT